jgi:hypothetical protein
MGYYSPLKRNGILTHVTRMNHKDMLSEKSQTQKEKYYIFYLCEVLREVVFVDTEGRMVVARGRGKGVHIKWEQSCILGR